MKRLNLRFKCFSGHWSEALQREVFERGHSVAVLLYDPEADAVVLVEQFRVGAILDANPWVIELVAGMIEAGENAEQVAHRETFEEAGGKILKLTPICDYLVSPGGTTENMSLFLGQVDSRGLGGIHGLAEEGEDIRVHVLPFQQALDWLKQGKIRSGSTIIALQWLQINQQAL